MQKAFILFPSVLLSLTLASCGDDDKNKDEDPMAMRFMESVVDEEVTIEDSDTDLVWVNGLEEGSSKAETGCNPMPAGLSEMDALDEAKAHCEMLSFGGFEDWRVPTPAEIRTYTVALNDEGIVPFYQNVGCPRVVGIEDDGMSEVLKTVNTHNTSPIGMIGDWMSTNAGVRCVRSDDDDVTAARFEESIVDEEVTLFDTDTSLTWVNGLEEGSSKAETGCNPMPSGLSEGDALAEAKAHCDMLSFAGVDDWRVPTPDEIQTYTVALSDAGIVPFYQNTGCPRVVGIEDDGMSEVLKTVNTHNTSPIGMIGDWMSTNAGVRCVR